VRKPEALAVDTIGRRKHATNPALVAACSSTDSSFLAGGVATVLRSSEGARELVEAAAAVRRQRMVGSGPHIRPLAAMKSAVIANG
jgi:hypothetical protein